MEDAKFDRIATEGKQKLTALLSPLATARGGQPIAYNAYLRGLEVVVLGYQFAERGTTFTKPVAIIVDGDMFDELSVDEEAGRVDQHGVDHQHVWVGAVAVDVPPDRQETLGERFTVCAVCGQGKAE